MRLWQSSKILDSVGEVLFQQLVQIRLYFLTSTRLNPWQIQFFPLLSIEHTTLHQFEAQFVVLQPYLLAIRPLVITDQLLLDIILPYGLIKEVLV